MPWTDDSSLLPFFLHWNQKIPFCLQCNKITTYVENDTEKNRRKYIYIKGHAFRQKKMHIQTYCSFTTKLIENTPSLFDPLNQSVCDNGSLLFSNISGICVYLIFYLSDPTIVLDIWTSCTLHYKTASAQTKGRC